MDTKPSTGSARTEVRYAVLLSTTGQVHGSFTTRLLAAVEGRRLTGDHPGSWFEIVESTPDGWRTSDGVTPEEAIARAIDLPDAA